MKKHIFIDIDGTIFSHTSGMSENVKQAIVKAKENGHNLFVSTGRARSVIDLVIDSLPFDGYICAAGAHIEINNQVLKSQLLPKATVEKLMDYFTKEQAGFVMEGPTYVFYDELGKERFFSAARDKHKVEAMKPHMIPEHRQKMASEYRRGVDDVNKFLVYPNDIEHQRKIVRDIEKDVFCIVNPGSLGFEFVPHGISKAEGIKFLVDYLNLDHQNTIGIGDSNNDLEMLSYVQLGIAMGNAHDEVKEVADFVTKDVEEDGVVYAFEHLNII